MNKVCNILLLIILVNNAYQLTHNCNHKSDYKLKQMKTEQTTGTRNL